jgi:hypothetical protein
MNKLTNLLESLNRKERFFLVGDALGNPKFSLGQDYRNKLQKVTGLKIPSNAWVAMDYHIDWIAAAVHVTTNNIDLADKWPNPESQKIVRGTQEDVDLIVGFGDASETQLILIEAKGDTAWSNSQMKSKAARLGSIFGYGDGDRKHISASLVLTSPSPPTKRLETKNWPNWMTGKNERPIWMPMEMTGRSQLIRCDENMKKKATGGYAIIK